MPLGNWEGKISDEAEPEELPDFVAKKVTARDGMVKNMYNYTFLPTAKRYFLLINKTFLYFKQKGFLFGSLLNIRIFLMIIFDKAP